MEALRLRSGLTIRDLADRTGLNRSRVHRICVGKGRPRPRELALLRAAMDDVIRRQRSSDPDFLRPSKKWQCLSSGVASPRLAKPLPIALPLDCSSL